MLPCGPEFGATEFGVGGCIPPRATPCRRHGLNLFSEAASVATTGRAEPVELRSGDAPLLTVIEGKFELDRSELHHMTAAH